MIVPHEEYETSIYTFDEAMNIALSSLHLQQHPLLHYDETHLHGCTYDVHLGHLETNDFPCSLPSPFDVGGTSSHTWVKRYMIEEHYYWKQQPLLFHDDVHVHGCID